MVKGVDKIKIVKTKAAKSDAARKPRQLHGHSPRTKSAHIRHSIRGVR